MLSLGRSFNWVKEHVVSPFFQVKSHRLDDAYVWMILSFGLALLCIGVSFMFGLASVRQNRVTLVYQTFPVERFPGLVCYTLVTQGRFLVNTHGCNTIFLQNSSISVEKYVLPRASGKPLLPISTEDYIAILRLLLFGVPEREVPPLAPKGVLLLQDDAVVMTSALQKLDECHTRQVNCILGPGASMNYFAGASVNQPGDESKRFTAVEQLDRRQELPLSSFFQALGVYAMKEEKHTILVKNDADVERTDAPDTLAYVKKRLHRYKDIFIPSM